MDSSTILTAPMEAVVAEQGEDTETLDRLTALEMLQLLKEYKKRELLYVFQITVLQKEIHLLQNEMQRSPSSSVLHTSKTALLDPAINLEVRELRLRLLEKETELQKSRNELKASTFSADSVMGRRLINKCKTLQDENTDIGKMLLENQLQPLQLQIGILQKQLAFFKKQLVVLHQLNADLDRDNQHLVRQLQEVTTLYKEAQQERDQLKALAASSSLKHEGESGYSPRSSSSRRDKSSSRHGRRSSRKRSTDRGDDDHHMGGGHSRSDSQAHRSSRRQSPSSRRERRREHSGSRRDRSTSNDRRRRDSPHH